ncbi:hypothetical protein SALBM135S_09812 [Streptomyces alboniger]
MTLRLPVKLRLLAGLSAFVAAAGLSACSPSGSGDGEAGDGGRTTIDVWLMRDSVSAAFQKEFETGFEAAHPDIDVQVQIQEWEGIGEKVTAALAGNDAPDVIETGNTQVARFARSGGLLDLSDKVDDLGGEDWLKGLAEPGAYEGKQYGIPYYAANRVVVYRKDLFEKGRRRRLVDQDPRAVDRRDEEAGRGRAAGHLPAGPELVHALGLHLGRGRRPRHGERRRVEGRPRHPRGPPRHGLLRAAPGARQGPRGLRRGAAAPGRGDGEGAGGADHQHAGRR